MQSGPNLTGKEKGPANADGANGIKLVRVKKNLGLQSFRGLVVAIAVRFDAVQDCFLHFRGETQAREDGAGHFRPLGRVADFALGKHFLAAANVVEQGRGAEDIQTGVHQAAYMKGQVVDPFGVIRAMTATFSLTVIVGNG